MEQKTIYLIDHDQSLPLFIKDRLENLFNCEVICLHDIKDILTNGSSIPDLIIVKGNCIKGNENNQLQYCIEERDLPFLVLAEGNNSLSLGEASKSMVRYIDLTDGNFAGKLLYTVHGILLKRNEKKEKQLKRQLFIEKTIKIGTSITYDRDYDLSVYCYFLKQNLLKGINRAFP